MASRLFLLELPICNGHKKPTPPKKTKSELNNDSFDKNAKIKACFIWKNEYLGVDFEELRLYAHNFKMSPLH